MLLSTRPTRTINQLQTLTHLGHNKQQSSVLHQPGRSTNYKHWLTWATTNSSPSQYYTNLDDQPTTNIDSPEPQPIALPQDYTNLDDQPTTNIDSPGSQQTTVLSTTPTWTINQLQTLTHLSCNQQQSFSVLHQPGRSTNHKHWLTWATTNSSPSGLHQPGRSTNHKHWLTRATTNSSPSQGYTNPDYHRPVVRLFAWGGGGGGVHTSRTGTK